MLNFNLTFLLLEIIDKAFFFQNEGSSQKITSAKQQCFSEQLKQYFLVEEQQTKNLSRQQFSIGLSIEIQK